MDRYDNHPAFVSPLDVDSAGTPATPPLPVSAELSPATRLASARQRCLALFICIAIAIGTALLFPFAQEHWPRFPAFLPTYQTAIIFSYFVTSYLIYSHYCATRATSLLYLSGGCFYTAVILVFQFLSFPGMGIAPGSLVGKGQTTIWLWCFWHAGPSLGIFLYALSESWQPGFVTQQSRQTTVRFGTGLLLALAASVAAVTLFHDWLPVLDRNGDFHNMTTLGIAPAIQAMTAMAFLLLWLTTRFRTVLHIWLGVALIALLFDNTITMMGSTRLSVGWYVGRFNALLSAVVMLVIYLREFKWVYLKTVKNSKQLGIANTLLNAEISERIKQEQALLKSKSLLHQLAAHQDALKEQERKRIAEEIHDNLGQNILALRMDISWLHERTKDIDSKANERTTAALAHIDSTVKSIREIMNNLRPAVLNLGLLAAMEWQVSQFKRLSGIGCDLIVDEQKLEQVKMADVNVTAIFRVVQQSLTNIIQHASATNVVITVECKPDCLVIAIRDNGVGFDPNDNSKAHRFGLIGMKERLTQLSGDMMIDSAPGNGTQLTMSIPTAAIAVP